MACGNLDQNLMSSLGESIAHGRESIFSVNLKLLISLPIDLWNEMTMTKGSKNKHTRLEKNFQKNHAVVQLMKCQIREQK